jgi:hypothetical protein
MWTALQESSKIMHLLPELTNTELALLQQLQHENNLPIIILNAPKQLAKMFKLYSSAFLIASLLKAQCPYYLPYCIPHKCIVPLEMTCGLST